MGESLKLKTLMFIREVLRNLRNLIELDVLIETTVNSCEKVYEVTLDEALVEVGKDVESTCKRIARLKASKMMKSDPEKLFKQIEKEVKETEELLKQTDALLKEVKNS